ncbi:hypothetical protein B0H16DRAFT_1427336 [Mycena metata]|uniref:Uncharacterized protein n=1 Tax=Mycena metata TaxID=1033252 RepID=A0AAD7MTS8_9AGAR|nr:hypothetical protein B0H16DRAFT_1427336 [Mycena metata]
MLVTYQDDTTDVIVTDSSWLVDDSVPVDFAQLSFDDSQWPSATVLGAYGTGPWGSIAIPTAPPLISLAGATWVWTDVIPAGGVLPPGQRAFRRTFTPGSGEGPATLNIIISADNQYSLWVNGVLVGSGTDWTVAQQYTVNLARTDTVVLAVLANNIDTTPAGLIVSAEITMAETGRNNCTASILLVTDLNWVSTEGTIPDGWELPGFDDSTWPAVAGEGNYGVGPWTTLAIAAPSAPVDA